MSALAETNKVDPDALNVGDKLSRISYITVVEKKNGQTKVANETGYSWWIGNDILRRECFGVQFNEEEKVSRTELVRTLQQAGDTLFSATFKKKNGEKRVLVGRRKPGSDDTCFGRTVALECRNGEPPQERQIDHRTLVEVILRNKKRKLK